MKVLISINPQAKYMSIFLQTEDSIVSDKKGIASVIKIAKVKSLNKKIRTYNVTNVLLKEKIKL